jgi:TPR repeat protein
MSLRLISGCAGRAISALIGGTLMCVLLAHGAAVAWADAAAGSNAFEKGNFVRAMAEWASAAEKGDPDAEFGLGMLYERGDGDVRQSYKQADRWYQKAADHDHIGAQYRLALIWAVGGDDLPADPVEAYKWILLASEKGIANDVKAQLEMVIDRRQQAEAQKRAASWKEAHVKKAEPVPAAAVAATAASGSAAGAATAVPPPRAGAALSATAVSGRKAGGCPGWPFPTLPCTEQFPSLPGAPAVRAPAPAIPPPRAATPN